MSTIPTTGTATATALPHAPRRLGFLVLAVAMSATFLTLPGCGGGYGGYYDPYYGTLEVINDVDSSWGIDAVEVTAIFGPTEGFGVYLAPGDGWDVDLEPDDYEIRLLWSNGDEDVYYEWIGDGDWVTIVGWN